MLTLLNRRSAANRRPPDPALRARSWQIRILFHLLAAAVAAASLGLAGPAPLAAAADAAGPSSDSCFWVGPYLHGGPGDDLYLDTNAVYWDARFTVPAGDQVTVDGRYPHGRYFSFITYNSVTVSTVGTDLADVQIAPNPGSVNPFTAGNPRTDPRRA